MRPVQNAIASEISTISKESTLSNFEVIAGSDQKDCYIEESVGPQIPPNLCMISFVSYVLTTPEQLVVGEH